MGKLQQKVLSMETAKGSDDDETKMKNTQENCNNEN